MLYIPVNPAGLHCQSVSPSNAEDDIASPSATVRTNFLWKVEEFPIIDQLLQFPREVVKKSLRKHLFSYSVSAKEVTPTIRVTTGWGEEGNRLVGETQVKNRLKKKEDEVRYSLKRIPQLYNIYQTLAGNFPYKVLLERMSNDKETLLQCISDFHKELDQMYSLFFQASMQYSKLFNSKTSCEMTKDEKIDFYQEKLTEHNSRADKINRERQIFFSTPVSKKTPEETPDHEFHLQAKAMMDGDQAKRLNNFLELAQQVVDLESNESPKSYKLEELGGNLDEIFSSYYKYSDEIGCLECALGIALKALVELQYNEKIFSIANDLGIKPSDDEQISCRLSNLFSKL